LIRISATGTVLAGQMPRDAIHPQSSSILQLPFSEYQGNSKQAENKTIGIVGVGNVGSKVEKLARTLEMNVLLNDPPRARAEER
jgi:phosphoglycerate dehydrogenase-like enzyme